MTESARTTKNCMGALKSPSIPTIIEGVPPYEWVLASVFIFPERRPNALLEEHDKMVGNIRRTGPTRRVKSRPPALLIRRKFSKFQKTTGLSFWQATDLNIISVEAEQRRNSYRCHKRHAGEIPVSVLQRRDTLSLCDN